MNEPRRVDCCGCLIMHVDLLQVGNPSDHANLSGFCVPVKHRSPLYRQEIKWEERVIERLQSLSVDQREQIQLPHFNQYQHAVGTIEQFVRRDVNDFRGNAFSSSNRCMAAEEKLK